MKNLLFFFTIFFSMNGFAQTSAVPEPEFPSRPYYLKDGKLENLEKTPANFDMKLSGGGVGGANEYLTAFKAVANVRFRKDSIPTLYIKLEGGGDPTDKVDVSKAQIKKDRRRFMLESVQMGGKAKDMSSTKVAVTLKKVRDGLYQITFDAPLVPGEYAFMPPVDLTSMLGGGKLNLYCFGVD